MKKYCRIFSVFLCLILLFSVAYSPVKVNAYYFAQPGLDGLFSIWVSSGLATDSAEALSPVLQKVFDALSPAVQATLKAFEANSVVTFKATPQIMESFVDSLKQVMINGLINGYKITHSSVNVESEQITSDDVIAAGTELYMPTEEMLLNIELLTAQQLIVDYAKEQNALSKKMNTLLQNISYSFQAFSEDFMKNFASFQTMVHSYLSATSDWLFTINDTIKVKFGVVADWLSTINTNIVTKLNLMQDWFPTINNNLKTRLDTVATWLSTLNTNMKSELSQVKDWLKGIKTSITTQGQEIVEKLDAIYQQILIFPKQEQEEIITAPQIQVPIHAQQQVLVTDYASLGSAFELKLSWVPQIFNFLRELFSRIVYTGEPPKISVPLTASTGSVKFTSDVICLDMSFYEPYKPYGDLIISGFLWLGFGWNLYKRTPSILNGIGISQEPVASGNGYTGNYGKSTGSRNRGKNDD